jgi:hypothetical protein
MGEAKQKRAKQAATDQLLQGVHNGLVESYMAMFENMVSKIRDTTGCTDEEAAGVMAGLFAKCAMLGYRRSVPGLQNEDNDRVDGALMNTFASIGKHYARSKSPGDPQKSLYRVLPAMVMGYLTCAMQLDEDTDPGLLTCAMIAECVKYLIMGHMTREEALSAVANAWDLINAGDWIGKPADHQNTDPWFNFLVRRDDAVPFLMHDTAPYKALMSLVVQEKTRHRVNGTIDPHMLRKGLAEWVLADQKGTWGLYDACKFSVIAVQQWEMEQEKGFTTEHYNKVMREFIESANSGFVNGMIKDLMKTFQASAH